MAQEFYEPTQRLDFYVYQEDNGATFIRSTVQVWLRMGEYVELNRKDLMKDVNGDGVDDAYLIKMEVNGDAVNDYGYYWVGEKLIPIDNQQLYDPQGSLSELERKALVSDRIGDICPGNYFVVVAEVYTKAGPGGSVTNLIRKDENVEID